ncbi:MAG TPA: hypothetical protein VFQ99_05240, partial [Gallionella sp.]|nr:hypothetical protein [Gallionella sp.]
MAATITKETSPYGHIKILGNKDSGTATSGAATTLTDTSKSWGVNTLNTDRSVYIHTGTGAGQTRRIASNTASILTVSVAWTTNPDATSQYVISSNYADVQSANDGGSWGVVTTQGRQVRMLTNMVLGDNTSGNRTYFSDFNKQVEFAGTLPTFSASNYHQSTRVRVTS